MAENKTINKEQNRTENNEIVIMNFSGIYKEQQFYRNHAEMQEDISCLEVLDYREVTVTVMRKRKTGYWMI